MTSRTDILESFVLQSLKTKASEQMGAFPQYGGHFDDYELVRITRDVRTKMGLAFTEGELAIAKPQAVRTFPSDYPRDYRTVWSMRNKADTSIPLSVIGKV